MLFSRILFFVVILSVGSILFAADQVEIEGSVFYENTPLCALVLANGQFMFSCDGEGKYDLNVPLDADGKITLFAFAEGFAPFHQEITTGGYLDIPIQTASPDSQKMEIALETSPLDSGWVCLTGRASFEGLPVCALILANGEYIFSCEGQGAFNLEVPLDEENRVTLFGFADFFEPYKKTLEFDGEGNLIPSTLYVPKDFYYIQSALDSASPGDTVMVSDGIYTGEKNRNLNFMGKSLTLRSENGPENCIIDCEQKGRGVLFGSGETNNALFSGFTMINGNPQGSGQEGWYGGGIYIGRDSSPIIENCRIMNCLSSGMSASGSGGGIFCAKDSSPTITNCLITGNVAMQNGGGITCEEDSSVTILNCIISNNEAMGMSWRGEASSGYGGGICCNYASARIKNCLITGNKTFGMGGGKGGGVGIYEGDVMMTNCTVADNISFGGLSDIYFAAEGAGVHLTSGTIVNTILWGNLNQSKEESQPESVFIPEDPGEVNILYSDIEGGWSGEGDIDANPLFAGDGDYRLTENSPCIDAGTSEGAPVEDMEGNSRPQGAEVDMGAFEYGAY